MEDILIVTNYYPPEKGAAANRIEQLALKLKQNNYNVTVLSPLANYPKGEIFEAYKGKIFTKETIQEIVIKRLWIYPSVSKNPFKRFIAMFSFSFMLFFYLLFFKTPKKIIIQSPPLLISFTGVLVSRLKRKKIILNVSDLWPSAAVELKAVKENSFAHKNLLLLEKYIYKNASLIICQSDEIITHIKSLFPDKKCFLYRNYPDHGGNVSVKQTANDQPIKLFYAGLLGVAQGVYEICQQIQLNDLPIELHIYGDGAEKKQIEKLIQTNPNKKIFFYGMIERNALKEEITNCDIAFVPLKMRLYGSVPSKIFEYSLLGFPIFYYGGGEGEYIVNDNNIGWVGNVGDFNSLNALVREIASLSKNQIHDIKLKTLKNATQNFNLDNQIENLIKKGVF